MVKNCKTCVNNVEYPPPHTCDECTSLDAEEEYEMWTPEKTCLTCKYGQDEYDSPRFCYGCDNCYSNYVPAYNEIPEEDSFKGAFYVKVICRMPDKDIEVSEIKLTDLVNTVTADMVDSFCRAIEMK